MKTVSLFKFGQFEVDPLARTVQRQDVTLALNRRAFDLLLYFVRNPGRLLSKDELLKNVWPDAAVDENSLMQSISVLRRALDEKPGENRLIVTLPGRGYQFVSPVQVVPTEDASLALAPAEVETGGAMRLVSGRAPCGRASSPKKDAKPLPDVRRSDRPGVGLGWGRGSGLLHLASLPAASALDDRGPGRL